MTKRTEHIREISFDGVRHNNKMERMNCEILGHEEVMRSRKTPHTPIVAGYQIYHNFVRPHLGLKGKTPADVAGNEVQGDN